MSYVIRHMFLAPVAMLAYLMLAFSASAEVKERRVALVIGNQSYEHVEALENPHNDIEEISAMLRRADFDVTIGRDLSKIDLENLVRKFLRELNDGSVGLFYYSGHAVQVGEQNFLIPVDAELASPFDLEFESFNIANLLSYMRAASRMQIVILDACRDNPFEQHEVLWGERRFSLGKTRGLRRIKQSLGSIVSYATRPGEVAFDGEGPLSPFTGSIVGNALQPDLEIRQLMTVVREEVIKATGGRQVPWDDSTLTRNFYFVPAKEPPVVAGLHHVDIELGRGPRPLAIPKPVQPDGGAISAVIKLLPTEGQVLLRDKIVAEGAQLSPSELNALAYRPEDGKSGAVGVLGYEAEDEWGGKVTGLVTIAVQPASVKLASSEGNAKAAGAATEIQPSDEAQPTTSKADQEKAMAALSAEATVGREIDVGTGAQPLVLTADSSKLTGWATLTQLDEGLQLFSGTRVLEPGNKIPLAEMSGLSVRPQIDTANKLLGVAFEIDDAETGAPQSLVFTINSITNQCDQLAAQPFDVQGVSEGLLANELDIQKAGEACSAAIAQYPENGRFVFQQGRISLANGDFAEAADLFQRAAALGHVRASQTLGQMIRLGAGTKADPAKAFELFKVAADKGDPYAQHSIGLALLNGRGVNADKKTGLEYLQKSVEAGHTFSFNEMGYFYKSGTHVEKNVPRAMRYYEMSAARGDIYGFLNLGTLYRDGSGVEQDYQVALDWFLKAHDGGHPEAGTAIGLLYFNGQGVEKDPVEAEKWFRESSDRGDGWGAFNSAYMMLERSRDPDDLVEAARYLALATAFKPDADVVPQAKERLRALGGRVRNRAIQTYLSEAGYDVGSIDGALGRKSRKAIAEFYSDFGTKPQKDIGLLSDLAKASWEKSKPRYDLF
ncbi:MAG: caspase family protein [Stappiaceae bacterium]